MTGRRIIWVAAGALALAAAVAEAGLGQEDLAKRVTEIEKERFPVKRFDLKLNDEFTGRRFPIETRDKKFSAIGEKRAPIAVQETQEKKMIRPEVLEKDEVGLKMSPMNQRRTFMRNTDRLGEKALAPEFRNAPVGNVKDASAPAHSPSGQTKRPSMRDINRFSFQRNHASKEGVDVQRAGSGGP